MHGCAVLMGSPLRLPSRAMSHTDIVTSIDQRLTEAKAEIVRLEDAPQAPTNGEAPADKPNPPRVPRQATRRKPVRGANEVVPTGKLTALLDGSAGMSTSEL